MELDETTRATEVYDEQWETIARSTPQHHGGGFNPAPYQLGQGSDDKVWEVLDLCLLSTFACVYHC